MTFDDTIADQSQVTQCPHCNTAFLVSDEQLIVAHGQVRCGSCLGIFEADQYWLKAEVATANNSTFADTNAVGKAPPKGKTHTASALDADSLAALASNNTATASDRSSDFELSDSFLELTASEAAQAPFEEYTAEDRDAAVDEEQWARELLEEEEPQDKTPRNELLCAIMDQPAGNRQTKEMATSEPAGVDDIGPDERVPAQLDSAEKWMQQVLGQDSPPEQAETTDDKPAPRTMPEPAASEIEEPVEEYVPEIFRKADQAIAAKPLLQSVTVKPLHMRIGERAKQIASSLRDWLIRMSTMVTIGIALVILALQLIWFNAERLSGQPLLRPAITQFCAFGGCTLPVARVSNAVSQSAPTAYRPASGSGLIIMETLLTNETDARHPYPKLHVELVNQQGRAIATRTFLPAEYLPSTQRPAAEGIADTNRANSDLSDGGQGQMPAGLSTPILLQLIDPGPQAAHYRTRLIEDSPASGL